MRCFGGRARARFGSGMAASGSSAAVKESLSGRVLSSEKGDSRLYSTNGISREGMQELGVWETAEVTERASGKPRSEEIVSEAHAAVPLACAHFGVAEFLKELETAVNLAEACEIGHSRRPYARIRPHRFRAFAIPLRPNLWGFARRRDTTSGIWTRQTSLSRQTSPKLPRCRVEAFSNLASVRRTETYHPPLGSDYDLSGVNFGGGGGQSRKFRPRC